MPSALVKVKSKELHVPVGSILFNSLEEQGFHLDHGCLSGSCGACKVVVTQGLELLDHAGAVESDTIAAITKEQKLGDNIRLSCRAKVIAEGIIVLE